MNQGTRTKSTKTALILAGVVAGMVGLSFASVPLYDLFCRVTGYGGTPRTGPVAEMPEASDHTIAVRFDANVNSALPWQFRPVQREVRVRAGEEHLVHYEVVNVSDEPLVGTAVYSVTPFMSAPYFNKIQCFCFVEQRLEPGESMSMPVVFFVDPEIANDRDAREVTQITLSYTFHPAKQERRIGTGRTTEPISVAATAAGRDENQTTSN
ncbi:MAG: cytochrome c oxidase assembly protein [Rhodospirillales bacterium]|nr:MAG: cytochrome c oxidase assembly protein [Rhodospirillales bacterium]